MSAYTASTIQEALPSFPYLHDMDHESSHTHNGQEKDKHHTHNSQEKERVGRSANVYQTQWNTHTVAVKAFRYSSLTSSVWENFLTEAAFFSLSSHPNLVQCYGFFTSPSLSLVMEWVDMDLHHVLLATHKEGDSLSPHWHAISLGLASACEYIHSLRFLHRDVKPHNILLTHDFIPKLCDFGYVISLHNDPNLAGDKKGTSGWAAPEVMGGYEYSYSADVFSYGMCVWAMVSPGVANPFCGMTSSVYFAAIRSGKRPPLTIDGPFVSLIHRCWSFNSLDRPTFHDLTNELTTNQHIYLANKSA